MATQVYQCIQHLERLNPSQCKALYERFDHLQTAVASEVYPHVQLLEGPYIILPLMHTGMLRRLVAAFAASPRQSLMTAFMAPNGWTESLAAIYRVEAAPFLEAAVARGHLKMREAVPLELQCFEKYGVEDARAFFNVNTPQDLQQAATALGGTIAQETGEKFAEIPDRA